MVRLVPIVSIITYEVGKLLQNHVIENSTETKAGFVTTINLVNIIEFRAVQCEGLQTSEENPENDIKQRFLNPPNNHFRLVKME